MNAFITSKLDYGHSLLHSYRKMLLKKLQYVQNTAPGSLPELVNLITLRLFYQAYTGFLLVILLFLKFFCWYSNYLIIFHLALWWTD